MSRLGDWLINKLRERRKPAEPLSEAELELVNRIFRGKEKLLMKFRKLPLDEQHRLVRWMLFMIDEEFGDDSESG